MSLFAHWYETGTWTGESCGLSPTNEPMRVEGQTRFRVNPESMKIEELVVTRAGEKSDMITRTIGRTDDVVSTGSNFSRPDPDDARLMSFREPDYLRKYPGSCERKPYAELLQLPSMELNHFKHVKTENLFHATGGVNNAEVARVLLASARGSPI